MRTAVAGGRYGLWAVEEVVAVGHDPDKAEESSKRDKKPLRPATDERGHQKDEKRHHHARHDGYPGCLDYALRGERVGEHVPHASSGSVTVQEHHFPVMPRSTDLTGGTTSPCPWTPLPGPPLLAPASRLERRSRSQAA